MTLHCLQGFHVILELLSKDDVTGASHNLACNLRAKADNLMPMVYVPRILSGSKAPQKILSRFKTYSLHTWAEKQNKTKKGRRNKSVFAHGGKDGLFVGFSCEVGFRRTVKSSKIVTDRNSNTS